jgi:hypothetical protein
VTILGEPWLGPAAGLLDEFYRMNDTLLRRPTRTDTKWEPRPLPEKAKNPLGHRMARQMRVAARPPRGGVSA